MADNYSPLSQKFFSLSPDSSSDEEEVPLIQEPSHHSSGPYHIPSDSSSFLLPSTTCIRLTDLANQATEFGEFQSPENLSEMSRSISVPSKLQMRVNPDQASTVEPEHVPTRHEQSSVKHLTCFWWKEKGSCRFTDDECLYAHYDTGHHTEAPRQIIPGLPAVAGRTLERAVQNLEELTLRPRTAPTSEHGSRSGTPNPATATATATDRTFRMTSPFNVYHTQSEFNRVNSDNQFLKNLVAQNAQEKAVMMSHIESLKAENHGMKAELEGLRKAQEQLLAEREGLHARVNQLQGAHQGAFGAWGRARMGSESRFLGGLLDD